MTSATLTIDLAALQANWRFLADKVAPAECAAVVKADAYGVGLEQAAKALAAEGAETFFVARIDEGVRLRHALADATVYVLDGLSGDPQTCLAHNLRPVLGTRADVETWAKAGKHRAAALHLDTGMNRLGLSGRDLAQVRLFLPAINLPLVISHLASSERPDAAQNDRQIARFDAVRTLGARASLANSSGIFLPSKPWYDLVRPGYALYGGNPTPEHPNPMRVVVTLEAPILQVRDIAVGETVGYNGRWTAKRPSRIATVALGYADGIPRAAAGEDGKPGADVAIEGRRCPIVGRVSMDLITLDVTDIDPRHLGPGAPVEFLGATIGVDEFGTRAGTIGYEILTGLGRRYRRVYKGDSMAPTA